MTTPHTRARAPQRRGLHHFLWAAFLLILPSGALIVFGQEARRQRELDQAAYYRAQTAKLNEPERPQTLWRALSDNAAILGALTAALVALFTLVVNQQTALRARKDTEFYEALKRFGDKDSPTVRASAVAILAEMSGAKFFAWRWRKNDAWWRLNRKMVRFPYFDTVIDQLVTGLLIEKNSVVTHSTVGALRRMMPRNFHRSADSLREANWKLQQDMATHLEEFFTVKGVGDIAGDHKAAKEAWSDIESLTGCSREALLAVVHGSLYDTSGIIDHASRVMDVAKRPEQLRKVQGKLVDAGSRLRQNVALCEMLLQARSEGETVPLDFRRAYLANVSLRKSNLRRIDFTGAKLHWADLYEANLYGARFEYARLSAASLGETELTDAKLYGARIDEPAVFNGANWWRADFTRPEGPGPEASGPGSMEIVVSYEPPVDKRLLEMLLSHDGGLPPERLKEAHASVKAYVAWRNRGGEQAAAKRQVEPPPEAS